jgi:hypothetical protein
VPKKSPLNIESLCSEARRFAKMQSQHDEPQLFRVTDGKAVGTYFEHKFTNYLKTKYTFEEGSSASGIDFPGLNVDTKVTSINQPQSSCPFKSARQKIYGLGYSLLVFVYDKQDNPKRKIGRLSILHTIFVESSRTADYQTTSGLQQILKNNGNIDDITAFMSDRFLSVDETTLFKMAKKILKKPPQVGYLTSYIGYLWCHRYKSIVEQADKLVGFERIV